MSRASTMALISIVVLLTIVGEAQVVREHLTAGERSYYLLQQLLPEAPMYAAQFRLGVRPDGNMVVVYIADSITAPRDVLMQIFDPWGRRVAGPFLVESIDHYQASLAILVLADQTWIAWSQADGSWMRRIDLSGSPIGERVQLDSTVTYAWGIFLASNGDIVAAEFGSDYDEPYDPFGRYYALDGTPRTASFLIPTLSPTAGFDVRRCVVSNSGTTMFAYHQYGPSQIELYKMGTLGSSLGPQLQVMSPADGFWPFALHDSAFLAITSTIGSPQLARGMRIALDGTVTTSELIEWGFTGVVANAGGEFALIYDPIDALPSIVFHGPDFAARTPHIPFTRNTPVNVNPHQEQWPFSLAMTPNGTFWAPWSIRTTMPLQFYLTMLKPFVLGDLDGDGRLTNFDIDPFVAALTDRAAFAALYPAVPVEAVDIIGDMNGDSQLDNFDIDPFVDALLSLPP